MKADETNISLEEFVKELKERLPNFELNMYRLGEGFVKPKTFSEWMELLVRWNNT
jgi:hypothetical protein